MNFLFKTGLCLLFASPLAAQDFLLEKLPSHINSEFDEITPVTSRDGKTLFFTRTGFPDFTRNLMENGLDLSKNLSETEFMGRLRDAFSSIAEAPIADPVSSALNQDIWFAEGDGRVFEKVWHAPVPLNNALPNSLVAITPDPNEFIVINRFPLEGGLERGFSRVRRTAFDIWTYPKPLEIRDFYTLTTDVSLTMSFDGQILILSAARSDSRGDMDLYVCFREKEDNWSSPLHLGLAINTEARETTPYLSEDNQRLFFSSNRPGSLGGNDIFVSQRLDDSWRSWSEPLPLSPPVNSVADDSQPYFNMSTGNLYFSSKRDGSSDLFRVQIAPPVPTELTITGRILNARTGEPVRDAVVWYGLFGEKASPMVAPDGTFSMSIQKGVKLEMTATKTGYNGQPSLIFFEKNRLNFQDNYVVDLLLAPLERGAVIRLNPIYFEQSKASILSKSYPEIDRLWQIFNENPSLVLRVEGHTDDHGRAEDLLLLSELRAKAIKEMLVQKGISAARIEAVGLGSTQPVNDNSTPELRAENRRTEFRILKI